MGLYARLWVCVQAPMRAKAMRIFRNPVMIASYKKDEICRKNGDVFSFDDSIIYTWNVYQMAVNGMRTRFFLISSGALRHPALGGAEQQIGASSVELPARGANYSHFHSSAIQRPSETNRNWWIFMQNHKLWSISSRLVELLPLPHAADAQLLFYLPIAVYSLIKEREAKIIIFFFLKMSLKLMVYLFIARQYRIIMSFVVRSLTVGMAVSLVPSIYGHNIWFSVNDFRSNGAEACNETKEDSIT